MNSSPSRTPTIGDSEQFHVDNICLVLLVGIPGSGKSHFRLFLENYFKTTSNTPLGICKVFTVCYDDFSKVRNPRKQIGDSVSWKEDRLEIFKKIEEIIKKLKNNPTHIEGAFFKNIQTINSKIKNPDTTLLIIDDNMYYRSMRYEYFKLSRSYNLSFCQIFFNATKEDALEHNMKRDSQSRVPDIVIENMFDKLEQPNDCIPWEKNVIKLTPYLDVEKEGILDEIFSLIKSALKSPEHENLDSLKKYEAQQITSSNAMHQIDIVLKQLVGHFIKNKMKEKSVDPSKISQYFSEQRLTVLKKIKIGDIFLPVNLSEPISKDDIEIIKPILFKCLESISVV